MFPLRLVLCGISLLLAGQEANAADRYRLRAAHAADLGANEVLLSWTAPDAKKSGKLFRQNPDGQWIDLVTLPPGAAEYQDEGLSPNTSYVYRLVFSSQETAPTRVITSKDAPLKISLPLKGATELVLLTTTGGDNDFNDHSTWCSPQLVKDDGSTEPLVKALQPHSATVGWDRPAMRSIQVAGTTYPDSMMAHAPSRVSFLLDGHDREFQSLVGVEPSSGDTPGSVQFLAIAFPGREAFVSQAAITTAKPSSPAKFPPSNSPGRTTYYLDGERGRDDAPGTSKTQPWKTLDRLNSVTLAPGDKVFLKAGSAYAGRLQPHGSGSPAAPILIGKYGEGPSPRINAQGKTPEALLLENVEYYEISDLEITNLARDRQTGRAGVRLRAENIGVLHHLQLRRLFVHDVNGDLNKGDGDRLAGFGIQWVNKGRQKPSRFDDLLIEDCHLARTDRNGICGASDYSNRADWFASTRVVIRGNLLEDIGGDGIVPLGCEGALVEHNTIHGGRTRAPDYCAGIWPWSCDDTLIQFNEVSGMVGTLDGQGFDSDYNCRNTVIQYNYSHDNDGGFVLVCNNGGFRAPGSSGNTGTIIRYNISQNDRTRLLQFGGPCENTRIYNNVFFVGKNQKLLGVLQGNWGGANRPGNVILENNIFYVEGELTDLVEAGSPPTLRNNLIFGNYQPATPGQNTVRADPLFIAPGQGRDGFDSLAGYKLTSGSPAVGAGVTIPENGGRDFWGNSLPKSTPPAIGADQP